MSINFRPIGPRVLVKPEVETQHGAIFIPETARQRPVFGHIAALGGGVRDKHGNLLPWEFKVGDKVVFAQYGGTPVIIEGKEYKLLTAEELTGVIPE